MIIILGDEQGIIAKIGHQRQAVLFEEIAAEDVDIGEGRLVGIDFTIDGLIRMDVHLESSGNGPFVVGQQRANGRLRDERRRTDGIDEEDDVARIFAVHVAAAVVGFDHHVDHHSFVFAPHETDDGEFTRETARFA